MILVVGNKGNMGQRYSKILNYLGKNHIGVDVDTPEDILEELCDACHGVIIATPTNKHFDHLVKFSKLNKPVLCEKPFTKNMNQMKEICNIYKKKQISMVFQYSEMIDRDQEGVTRYDYFKHGGDGLAWDCIQILALAKGPVSLEEQSPIWRCSINDQVLSAGKEMDIAYIKNVDRWLAGQSMDVQYLLEIHQKVRDYESGIQK